MKLKKFSQRKQGTEKQSNRIDGEKVALGGLLVVQGGQLGLFKEDVEQTRIHQGKVQENFWEEHTRLKAEHSKAIFDGVEIVGPHCPLHATGSPRSVKFLKTNPEFINSEIISNDTHFWHHMWTIDQIHYGRAGPHVTHQKYHQVLLL